MNAALDLEFNVRTIATGIATLEDIDVLAALFDQYRQFYEQPSDVGMAKTFLAARIGNHESVVILAVNPTQRVVGFCQLYPTFCSVEAKPIYSPYDLFVAPEQRRSGAGSVLLHAAETLAAKNGKARMDLTTAKNNKPAQAAYEAFLLVPKTVAGTEVRLRVRASSKPYPASRAVCQAFNFEFGATISIPIEILTPEGISPADSPDLYIDAKHVSEVLPVKKGVIIEGYIKLHFSANDIGEVRARFHPKIEYPDSPFARSGFESVMGKAIRYEADTRLALDSQRQFRLLVRPTVQYDTSLKQSTNGRLGRAVRNTFSPTWAWRPAVVARLAPTLKVTNA